MRRISSVVVPIFLGFLILACCFPMGDAEQQAPGSGSGATPATTTPANPGTPPDAPAPPSVDYDFALGEPFQLGSFRYVVHSAEIQDSIGRSFGRERAAAGAAFLVVRYTETNEGTETEVVTEGPMVVKDAQGRTFRPSSRAMTALAMSGRADIAITELHPGVARESFVAFEVPAGGSRRILTVNERGLLGRRTARVLLRTRTDERLDRIIHDVMDPLTVALDARRGTELRLLLAPSAASSTTDAALDDIAARYVAYRDSVSGERDVDALELIDVGDGLTEFKYVFKTQRGRRAEPIVLTLREEPGRTYLVAIRVPDPAAGSR